MRLKGALVSLASAFMNGKEGWRQACCVVLLTAVAFLLTFAYRMSSTTNPLQPSDRSETLAMAEFARPDERTVPQVSASENRTTPTPHRQLSRAESADSAERAQSSAEAAANAAAVAAMAASGQ